MTEKGIDQLRADLAALDADCAEQIRKTVHDNYHQFIQACQVCNGSMGMSTVSAACYTSIAKWPCTYADIGSTCS